MPITKEQVRARALFWWKKACEVYQSSHLELTPPTVKFSARFRNAAGKANGSQNYIKIGLLYMNNESEEFIDKVIAHEIAHVFIDRYYHRRCMHGPEWRQCMRALGQVPNRCHSSLVYKPTRQERLNVSCQGCKTLMPLSKNLITRMKNGKRYRCVKCGTVVSSLLTLV